MERIEKTVFLSYRRTSAPWALAIYRDLTQHGFDVFFDYEGIASGDFEQIIVENIYARAHFLVILTPSALERCVNPDDWLRREIETALDSRRNIVPLMLEGFDFSTPAITMQLSGKLSLLKRYNGLSVPTSYFLEAMDRLRSKYLNVALTAVLHPASPSAQLVATEQKAAADAAPRITHRELASSIEASPSPVLLTDGLYTILQTSMGKIVCKLFSHDAPQTVANFIGLAEGTKEWNSRSKKGPKLYDGTVFHRVIPKFMIQGGDPEGTGMGGPGYKFADETKGSPHGFQQVGKLAMANSGPNTNGSQFFITVADTSWLTGKHTIFGEVVEGYDVVEKISKVSKDGMDRPKTPVVLESVTIDRVA